MLNKDTDECLNKLTKDMIELLEAWNKFFTLLHKEKPTQEDKNQAPVLADKAVQRKGVRCFVTSHPKVTLLRFMQPSFRDICQTNFSVCLLSSGWRGIIKTERKLEYNTNIFHWEPVAIR